MNKEKLWDAYWDDKIKEEAASKHKTIFSSKSLFDYFGSDHEEAIKEMMWWAYSQNNRKVKA